jgi:hypothetical protein
MPLRALLVCGPKNFSGAQEGQPMINVTMSHDSGVKEKCSVSTHAMLPSVDVLSVVVRGVAR